jgi:hypothetical protein
MAEQEIPDVGETDLTRDELEEAAEEVGVDPDGLDDQELLERVGVALGVVDEDAVDAPSADAETDQPDDDRDDDGPTPTATTRTRTARRRNDAEGAEDEDGDDGSDDGDGRLAGLRSAGRLGARRCRADRVRPDGDDEEPTSTDRLGGKLGRRCRAVTRPRRAGERPRPVTATQAAVGEPIDGPTRDELRDQLRDLDLPVSGSKEELAARLAEAQEEATRATTGRRRRRPDDGEQPAVGEPIDGPTRDELRDQLRELDLPVSGSKDELAARLAEAQGEDGGAGDVASGCPGRRRRRRGRCCEDRARDGGRRRGAVGEDGGEDDELGSLRGKLADTRRAGRRGRWPPQGGRPLEPDRTRKPTEATRTAAAGTATGPGRPP